MHLESDLFKRSFSNHYATWAFFFPAHFLTSGFLSKFRQEDRSDEERPLYWDFSSSSASCWSMWPWTERDNWQHPKWRWRWAHWLFLIQTFSGTLSSALSISFEGDINKQECIQVAGDGGRNGGQVKMLRSWEALVYCSEFPHAIVRLIAHRNLLCSQYFSGQSR